MALGLLIVCGATALSSRVLRRSISIAHARSIVGLDQHDRPTYVGAVKERALARDPSAPPAIRALANTWLGIWVQGRIRDLKDPETRAERILWDPDGFSQTTRLFLRLTGGFDPAGIQVLEDADVALLAEVGVARADAERWFLLRYGAPYDIWDPVVWKKEHGLDNVKLYAEYGAWVSQLTDLGVAAIESRQPLGSLDPTHARSRR